MALQLWFPFTIDTRNNGCCNSAITNDGVTLNADGKLGGCHSFNGSSYILGTHNVFSNNTTDWSFACWLKLNNTNSGQCIFSCRSDTSSYGIFIEYDGSSWVIDDGARWMPSASLSANTWYHLCVVKKDGVGKKLYINGELVSSNTTSGTPTKVSSTNYSIGGAQTTSTNVSLYYFNGYLNDVRVYDHAISPLEVWDINRGLVRQYKFDNYIDKTVRDCSGCNYDAVETGTGTITETAGAYRYQKSLTFNGTKSLITAQKLPADTKTVSIWLKTSWIKPSSSQRYQFAMIDKTSAIAVGWSTTSSGQFIPYVGTSSVGPRYLATHQTYIDSYIENQWNHICVVKTSATGRDVYINGNKLTSSGTNYWNTDLEELDFGARHVSGAYESRYFNGQISDFRAYLTEFTEDDVKKLYYLGAEIGNAGDVWSYELDESTTTKTQITRVGTLKASKSGTNSSVGFVESSGSAKILDNQVSASAFIEL